MIPHQAAQDQRPIATLDAGGTKFSFSVLRGGRPIAPPIECPSHGDDLDRCLRTLLDGFRDSIAQAGVQPSALSFAFPGPADYARGIIGDLHNLPAFRGGVPLGPMLEEHFGVPVFINNDGDLFAYGEAMGGLLPEINEALAARGSDRRYRNLVGVTVGTGFGGGIAIDGRPLLGDNGAGAEVWLLRHKNQRATFAEEGISIRAVTRAYHPDPTLSPRDIHEIALGHQPGDRAAAARAFEALGEILGDALAQLVTLVDGLVVIGGGLSAAHELFLPRAVDEMNRAYTPLAGGPPVARLESRAFNLQRATELDIFLDDESREVAVPLSSRKVSYRSAKKCGVGVARLGTSQAIALGAYAYALRQLDQQVREG